MKLSRRQFNQLFLMMLGSSVPLTLTRIFPIKKALSQEPSVTVSTVEELFNELASNKTIYLNPGQYIFSQLDVEKGTPVKYFSQVFDGFELVLEGLENLTLKALDSKRYTALLTAPRYADVIRFRNCKNIELEGLEIGHSPEKGYCQGDVLGFQDVDNVQINNCNLFGSGTRGIEGVNISNLKFNQSVIRNCTYGILNLENCRQIYFEQSKFYDNQQYDLIQVNNSQDIVFNACEIYDNFCHRNYYDVSAIFAISNTKEVDESLGEESLIESIVIEKSKIYNNRVLKLIENPTQALVLKNTILSGNEWQTGTIIKGLGTGFPVGLQYQWFTNYNQENPNQFLLYDNVSDRNVFEEWEKRKQKKDKVDFILLDRPLKTEEKNALSQPVYGYPVTAEATVIVCNLPGLSQPLKLSRAVYADIFLGKIKQWNDTLIARSNPELTLPALPIQVIYPKEESLSTLVLSRHLSAINAEWKQKFGVNSKLNEALLEGQLVEVDTIPTLKKITGGISYFPYRKFMAQQNGISSLPIAALENKAGEFITPTLAAITESLESVESVESLESLATFKALENSEAEIFDPSGKKAYPLLNYAWVFTNQTYDSLDQSRQIKALLRWLLERGQNLAVSSGYPAFPLALRQQILTEVENIKP